MTIEQHMGNSYRYHCDNCSFKRVDYGIPAIEELKARHEVECPGGGRPVSKTVTLQCWEKLDDVVDRIMDTSAALRVEVDEGRKAELAATLAENRALARGMADIMVLWTGPYFRTTEAISTEAMHRANVRRGGERPYTLGTVIGNAGTDLAVHRQRLPESEELRLLRERRDADEKKRSRGHVPVRFDPEAVLEMTRAKAAGFTLEMLAKIYLCEEADIEYALTHGSA